jgi:hypothetical protein
MKKLKPIYAIGFFEWTCKWGLSPGRPLLILLLLIGLFSMVYMFSIVGFNKVDGIWRVWIPERVRQDLGKPNPERLILHQTPKVIKYSLYFSLLSSFNIGWRDLNVGHWIARMQPREFSLRASGWVRTVSGLQSLISVYLLALAVLSYFSRPFDQF